MKKICFLVAVIMILSTASYSFADAQENSIGCISIPCLDITMPIYSPEVNEHEYRQAIIDNEESALYNNWGTAYYICDHIGSVGKDGKGEWYIQKVFPGAYAYLYINGGRYYYECYMAGKTEYDGNEYINGRLVEPCSSHDIMLSCCAEDADHHFIAVFRRLSEF